MTENRLSRLSYFRIFREIDRQVAKTGRMPVRNRGVRHDGRGVAVLATRSLSSTVKTENFVSNFMVRVSRRSYSRKLFRCSVTSRRSAGGQWCKQVAMQGGRRRGRLLLAIALSLFLNSFSYHRTSHAGTNLPSHSHMLDPFINFTKPLNLADPRRN